MTNEYSDPRMWTDRYQEFALGAIGTGITVGDYDNDGLPDLFVVNKTGKSILYRNLGNWKFEDATDAAGLGETEGSWVDSIVGIFGPATEGESAENWKQGATFVDVDNDGWLDLYLCKFNAPNVLYLNDGGGRYEAAENSGLELLSASGMASFCDFNRDGFLDVYVQTNMLDAAQAFEGSRDRLYLNNGDATFSDITDSAGISENTLGHAAICWDYDGDGWPDIYVANDFAKPDQLYRNESGEGKVRFREVIDEVVPYQPFSSMGADIADINNDGLIDFFVADMAPTTHEKDQRGMAVTRHTMQSEIQNSRKAPQYMFNALYLNTGSERVMEISALAGLLRTDWTWSVRFEDLDCDGFVDLHVTNGMVREYQNDDLRQKIFKAEHPSFRMRIMRASPLLSESNLAFRNLGGLSFERVESSWG
ncbi:VCBS repeat-containing protein, partial [Pelagicoccus sp. SDUM812002]|uniref:FG-GAP repeat domain-containing protein n=1 Tax=Pelagicoccus sp. SDUM812002 TaxID=3041266 RepID=UPI002811B505